MKHIKQQVVITLFFITFPAINFTMEYKYKKNEIKTDTKLFKKVDYTIINLHNMYQTLDKKKFEKMVTDSQKILERMVKLLSTKTTIATMLKEFSATLKKVNKQDKTNLYTSKEFYSVLSIIAETLNRKHNKKDDREFEKKLTKIKNQIPWVFKRLRKSIEDSITKLSEEAYATDLKYQTAFYKRLEKFKNLLTKEPYWKQWQAIHPMPRSPSCPLILPQISSKDKWFTPPPMLRQHSHPTHHRKK